MSRNSVCTTAGVPSEALTGSGCEPSIGSTAFVDSRMAESRLPPNQIRRSFGVIGLRR